LAAVYYANPDRNITLDLHPPFKNAAGGLKKGLGVHHTNIKVIKNVIL
jgi:hypothetical protein